MMRAAAKYSVFSTIEKVLRFLIDELEVIAALVATAIGFILHYLGKVQTEVFITLAPILVGLLFIHELRRDRAAEKDREALRELRSALREAVDASAAIEEVLRLATHEFRTGEVPAIWRSLLWRIRETYSATNYMKFTDLYTERFAEAALAIQDAQKLAHSVTIKKVFIVDDLEELDIPAVRAELDRQAERGFALHYITRSKLTTSEPLRGKSRDLATIDFGLFDSRIALLWLLNEKTRQLKGGKVLIGRETVKPYIDFFEELFLAAIPYTPAASGPRIKEGSSSGAAVLSGDSG